MLDSTSSNDNDMRSLSHFLRAIVVCRRRQFGRLTQRLRQFGAKPGSSGNWRRLMMIEMQQTTTTLARVDLVVGQDATFAAPRRAVRLARAPANCFAGRRFGRINKQPNQLAAVSIWPANESALNIPLAGGQSLPTNSH